MNINWGFLQIILAKSVDVGSVVNSLISGIFSPTELHKYSSLVNAVSIHWGKSALSLVLAAVCFHVVICGCKVSSSLRNHWDFKHRVASSIATC